MLRFVCLAYGLAVATPCLAQAVSLSGSGTGASVGLTEQQRKWAERQIELGKVLSQLANQRHEMLKAVARSLRDSAAPASEQGAPGYATGSPRPSDDLVAQRSAAAIAELNRRSAITQNLTSWSTTSANMTIDLMHAMSPH